LRVAGEESLIKKILIADDESLMRSLIVRCVSDLNCPTIEADSGPAAVEIALRELPDLILLDYIMPGMSGLEAAAQMRQDTRLDGSTIVMITSEPEPVPVKKISVPYHGWILKPFDPLTLKDRLIEIVKTTRWTPRPFMRRDKPC
jgi:CheY-like chemotaxis protein